MSYREDINGLRAIAILLVIFFHSGIKVFENGYVGVDIFFVISGYLITNIILQDIDNGSFSIKTFYEKRALRILPAMFFVIGMCIFFGWFSLLPGDYKIIGQEVFASIIFCINILFYLRNEDYFGVQSNQNPLLHLWSLSIEEQFYLVLPILLILLCKLRKSKIFIFICIFFLAVLSLGISIFWSEISIFSNFYLLPARGWELLAGSLLAIQNRGQVFNLNRAWVNDALAILGLIMIIFYEILLNTLSIPDKLLVFCPVIGTLLILAYSKNGGIVSKLLSNKLLVIIGLISFSAYLWHQPIFSFYRIWVDRPPGYFESTLLIFLTMILAYITWRYLENPIRIGNRHIRLKLGALLTVAFIFCTFSMIGQYNGGYPDRDPLYKRLASNVGLSLECNGNYGLTTECSTSPEPTVAIFGNSYAMHLVEGFKSSFPDNKFVQLTQDTCGPNEGDKTSRIGKMNCHEFYEKAMLTIIKSSQIKTIIISSPFNELINNESLRSFENTLETLSRAKKTVIIVGPTPFNGDDFGKCFLRNRHIKEITSCNFSQKSIPEQYFRVRENIKYVAEKYGFDYIDLYNLLCNTNECITSYEDVLIYRDAGHLSIEGSRFIFSKIKNGNLLKIGGQ